MSAGELVGLDNDQSMLQVTTPTTTNKNEFRKPRGKSECTVSPHILTRQDVSITTTPPRERAATNRLRSVSSGSIISFGLGTNSQDKSLHPSSATVAPSPSPTRRLSDRAREEDILKRIIAVCLDNLVTRTFLL